MSRYDEETVMRSEEDRRYVEDDLMQLNELDNSIRELLSRREQKVNDIKKANARNTERLDTSEDWFEGDLKGRPVPARMSNGMGDSMSSMPGPRDY